MTLLQLEEVYSDDLLARQAEQTVKCSWCGAIIRLDGSELALAMCQSCYERMLKEFHREQRARQSPMHSDR